jgi:hypothetical protein
MLISVKHRDGSELFSYSTEKDQICLHPARTETPAVIEALLEAVRFLAIRTSTPQNNGT